MADLYALSEEDCERLRRLLRAFEDGRLDVLLRPRPTPLDGPIWCRMGQTSADIAALSGSTPGSGTVELYQLDPTASYVMLDTHVSETAYNLSDAIVKSGTTVVAVREPISGQ